MSTHNRLANAKNPYQGNFKKVLCVCSAGLLRSPTAAFVLSQEPFNYNTRAAGLNKEYALIQVDEVLLEWADEIVCMDDDMQYDLEQLTSKPIICLNVPDHYNYRDDRLCDSIIDAYQQATKR